MKTIIATPKELGDDSKYVGEDASGSEDEGSDDDDDEEEEDSEGFSSDEDHHTMLETSDKRERNSGSAEGSSLSLRAQVVSGWEDFEII